MRNPIRRMNRGVAGSMTPAFGVLAFGLLAATIHAADASAWNCFRGPKQGVSPWTNAPAAWDGQSGKGVLWKTPLKMAGIGSPVVCGTNVYLLEADEQERAVLAFDAATGRRIWRQVVADGGKGADLPQVSGDTGLAAPTPVCDEKGVYALFGTGDLAAFSPGGKLKWQVFLKRPENMYGHASSLCIAAGRIYIQYDQAGSDSRVLAVDTADGRTVWETPRAQGPSWSSPIIVPGANSKPLFVVNASGAVSAYDPATGKNVWEVEGVTGEVAPSPAYADGRIYAVNAGSRLVCYKVGEKIDKVWEYTDNLADISSPIVVNGLLFMVGGGQFVCLDAVTGKEIWVKEGAVCYSSLIASGDRVYACGRDGTTIVFEAKRVYRQIVSCNLGGDAVDSTPAMGDGRIYIRGKENLWCLGVK